MNIIVCVKQVIDPEAPLSSFKIDPESKRAIPPAGTPPVLSPYDENAMEAALQIKDTDPSVKITVLTMGAKVAMAVVKKALAVGGHELVVVQEDGFDNLDSVATVTVLAAAINKIGQFDLIVCGRQASDTDAGQVGSGLAEVLGLPVVTLVRKIEKLNGKVRGERVLDDGYEVVEVPTPAVVTVSNEVGDLRLAPLKDIMAAAKKPVTNWKAADLGLDGGQVVSSAGKVKVVNLFIPVRETKCELIVSDSPEDAGAKLALRLREAKVL